MHQGGPGRPHSYLFIEEMPKFKIFTPRPMLGKEPVELLYPEFEAVRLSDLEKLTQEEVAARMKTSRGTAWRLLESGREKIARAIVESRPLVIAQEGELDKA
jgi:predicted DNA-binding protein (UPF0251 family)